MSNRNTKKRIFDIIQIGNKSDLQSRAFDYTILAAILLNIVVSFLQTFDSLAEYKLLFRVIIITTSLLFLLEYILRIWTAEYLYPRHSKGRASVKFVFSFDGIVLLLTILPFFFLSGFVVFRMLRVVRILHLFLVNRTTDSFGVIGNVLYSKSKQLISSIFIIILLILASSLFMYSAEHAAQPEVFKNAFSGIWWSVNTLFTVGYGDIYPVTMLGRFMAIVITFLGVMLVAIPTGIISAGFVENYTKVQNTDEGLGFDIKSVLIDIDSAWIGKSIGQIEAEHGINIVLVKHEDVTLLPEDDYFVGVGDAMLYYKEGKK